MKQRNLILVRHGQSEWNEKNLFTGWENPGLTKKGTEINQKNVNTIENKALNERFYGDLQGLNKDECRKKWGDEKVQMWRRSYDQGPPGGETLKQTGERVVPYFIEEIEPLVKNGSNILIAAHGNSLRSLIKFLDDVTDEDIVKLEIPTGAPIHYIFDSNGKVMQRNNLF